MGKIDNIFVGIMNMAVYFLKFDFTFFFLLHGLPFMYNTMQTLQSYIKLQFITFVI